MMSRITAPVGEVTTPTRLGKRGRGRLRSRANSPSASSRARVSSSLRYSSPNSGRLNHGDVELILALRLVDRDPALSDRGRAVGGIDRTARSLVAEDDTPKLRAGVLECEVGVPGVVPTCCARSSSAAFP